MPSIPQAPPLQKSVKRLIWSHAEKLMHYINAKTQLQVSKPQLVLHKGDKSLTVQLIMYQATTDQQRRYRWKKKKKKKCTFYDLSLRVACTTIGHTKVNIKFSPLKCIWIICFFHIQCLFPLKFRSIMTPIRSSCNCT